MSDLQWLPIDYQMLAAANKFYKNKGYQQIEVPWMVSEKASLLTAQKKSFVFVTDYAEHLVGSAEQGFIDMMLFNSDLSFDQKFQAISPCFRRETTDATHSQWFVKLELFYRIKDSEPLQIMKEFISDAKEMFRILNISVDEVPQADKLSIDLMHDNLELGSYGYRKINDMSWVYGTGLALPRAQLITQI